MIMESTLAVCRDVGVEGSGLWWKFGAGPQREVSAMRTVHHSRQGHLLAEREIASTSNFSTARHARLSLSQPHPHEVSSICCDECPSESQGKQSRLSEMTGLTLLPSATRAEEPSKAAG